MTWTSLVISALAGAGLASAGTITVTEAAIATGSLGGTPFDSLITLTASGNTSNVTRGPFPNLFVIEGLPLTVDVASLGVVASLAATGYVYSDETHGIAGIGFLPQGAILGTEDGAFSTYTLTTSIGPVIDTGFINDGLAFSTDRGSLVLDSVSGDATFTATVAPEPSTVALWGFGLAGLAVLKRHYGQHIHRLHG